MSTWPDIPVDPALIHAWLYVTGERVEPVEDLHLRIEPEQTDEGYDTEGFVAVVYIMADDPEHYMLTTGRSSADIGIAFFRVAQQSEDRRAEIEGIFKKEIVAELRELRRRYRRAKAVAAKVGVVL